MRQIYKEFVEELFNDQGELALFRVTAPDDFNFAYDVVDRLAERSPEKRAMVWCNDHGEEYTFTFKDMKEKSDATAAFLQQLGIKKGDKVMLILKRHYEFWFTILALHKLGAIAIPATNQLQEKDIVYRINVANISMVVCTGEGTVSDEVDKAAAQCPSLKTKVMVRGEKTGWESFNTLLANAPAFIKPELNLTLEDPCLLYFTSGTTGMPKMVAHNFHLPLNHVITAVYWQDVKPDGLHLTISETGWMKAMWGKLYGQWLAEAGIFVYDMDRFHAGEVLKRIEKYKVTSLCAPPTMFNFFLLEGLEKYDLSSLQHTSIAGEALNPDVFNRFYQATGLKLMEGFGQTEAALMIATLRHMEPKIGSMGKPVPSYGVDLLDKEGNSVAAGTVGEIVVKTDDNKHPYGLFMNYYQDEERTNAAWHDGYYHTGDMAWKDEDGYYWYVSRIDDVIKSSGYRIGPFEVESVLMEHPAVLECAITGVPDEIRGQVVKATIVLNPGYEAGEELKKELQNFVKHKTAPYKYPRIIDFVAELPKTISGKIRRSEIRKNK